VESLIEHRLSTEGPSSPVPGDLLRLSIGLETPEDLLADLRAALDSSRKGRIAVSPTEVPATEDGSVQGQVLDVLRRSVEPLVIARGGAVRLARIEKGVVTLEVGGSPGAVLPAEAHIKNLLRASVAGVTEVRLVWPEKTDREDPGSGALTDRVQAILDTEINPAVAVHGGRVALVEAHADRVSLRLEGGCQGCNLAIVTLRQGIEPLLRARLGRSVTVVDATDHAAGTAPFFTPSKR
ncbi:MAG: NifU family protein, partial [Candidatus Tectomicrobia bacterium]|nr:NifU family protein [Candidatus Tectomicrobia bacterium]